MTLEVLLVTFRIFNLTLVAKILYEAGQSIMLLLIINFINNVFYWTFVFLILPNCYTSLCTENVLDIIVIVLNNKIKFLAAYLNIPSHLGFGIKIFRYIIPRKIGHSTICHCDFFYYVINWSEARKKTKKIFLNVIIKHMLD